MRHIRSIFYALVLAPAAWVLTGVGLTGDLTVRGRDGFAVESLTGLLLLLLAGAAYGILVLGPFSPAGPLLAGVVYLALASWALISPSAYADVWPHAVAKDGFDLSRPGYGLAALLAVPLICTALSARRWAQYEPPVLPVIGQIGRARATAPAAGVPLAATETAVLGAPALGADPTTVLPRPPDTTTAVVGVTTLDVLLGLPDDETTLLSEGPAAAATPSPAAVSSSRSPSSSASAVADPPTSSSSRAGSLAEEPIDALVDDEPVGLLILPPPAKPDEEPEPDVTVLVVEDETTAVVTSDEEPEPDVTVLVVEDETTAVVSSDEDPEPDVTVLVVEDETTAVVSSEEEPESDVTVLVVDDETTAVVSSEEEPESDATAFVIEDETTAAVTGDDEPVTDATATDTVTDTDAETETETATDAATVADEESTAAAFEPEPESPSESQSPPESEADASSADDDSPDNEEPTAATLAEDRTEVIRLPLGDSGDQTQVVRLPVGDAAERTQVVRLPVGDAAERADRSQVVPFPTPAPSSNSDSSSGEKTQVIKFPARSPRAVPGERTTRDLSNRATGDVGGDETQVIRLDGKTIDDERTQVIRPMLVPPPTDHSTVIELRPAAPRDAAPRDAARRDAGPVSIADAEAPDFADDPTSPIIPPHLRQPADEETTAGGKRSMTVMNMERPPDERADETTHVEIPSPRRPVDDES
ncbi:hypothetical protein ACQP2F_05185 [Actinoplanes sp. CA-030573]|uniref:hypothetical protein n=1 Tax=Actinoplanes sp. CA-030573 TaxID=3239898 RepID=UPI003D92444C